MSLALAKNLAKGLWLSTLILAGGVGIYVYERQYSAARQIAKLEEEKKELEQIVTRLTSERRVAEMLVTSQRTVNNVPQSEVLLVEYDKAGQPLPAKSFTVLGKMVHVDALVIKFDRGFVKNDDPLKGHSIALFTKIYGDNQAPADAPSIDEPNTIPAVYQNADSRVTEFERTLWRDFWRLADDAAYRQEKGVRVAQGEGPWAPLLPNRLYTLSLEAAGGLNLTSEPLKGIYREALKPAASK
jgi:hypothetical protein